MQDINPSAFANTETAQTPVKHYSPTRVLFHHEPHQHQPRNVNKLDREKLEAAGFNARIAVALTKRVGTMWTAYSFAVLAIIGLFAILGLLHPIVALLVAWLSQTFIQLVLLPIIMVGQNVLGHHAELIADEQFNTTMSTYHDIEQIMQHLSAQDAELLHHTKMLLHLLEKNGISLQQLEAEVGKTSQLESYTQKLSTNAPVNPDPTESEESST